MKREVEREIRLPAFALTLGELELLWKRIRELFDDDIACTEEIALAFPSERIRFDSFEELKGYDRLRGQTDLAPEKRISC
jgi:hypothetical protein